MVQYLRERTKILGVISMPVELFQPHTHAKTCVLFLENSTPPSEPYDIFMSVVSM